jgi:hypothetical protein
MYFTCQKPDFCHASRGGIGFAMSLIVEFCQNSLALAVPGEIMTILDQRSHAAHLTDWFEDFQIDPGERNRKCEEVPLSSPCFYSHVEIFLLPLQGASRLSAIQADIDAMVSSLEGNAISTSTQELATNS